MMEEEYNTILAQYNNELIRANKQIDYSVFKKNDTYNTNM